MQERGPPMKLRMFPNTPGMELIASGGVSQRSGLEYKQTKLNYGFLSITKGHSLELVGIIAPKLFVAIHC